MAASVNAWCSCDVCIGARTVICQIFRVLNVYGWFLDSYVVDFFQERLWSKLSGSWTNMLQDVSPEEFGRWMSGESSYQRVWPLSLLALRKVAKVLQINRDHLNSVPYVCSYKSKNINMEQINSLQEKEKIIDDSSYLVFKENNLFKKHVKMKKRHEIDQIAQVCAQCAWKSNCKCVVDIGAGMGHLARVLAFRYGLYVTCIEQQTMLSEQARKCDQEFLMSIRKHVSNFKGKSPHHLSIKVDTSSDVTTKIIEDLQKAFANTFHLDQQKSGLGFIGLHPCGDLAATLLHLYTLRNEAKFICIVGCCYMKLTLECSSNMPKGYPLSQYMLEMKNHKLSYAALEVACHAIEKHCDKLKTANYSDLMVHTYRAALETILIRKSQHLRRTQLKNVKVKEGMTFEQYCLLVTSDLKSDLRPTVSDLRNKEIVEYMNDWKKVVIFGSLRLMLAPLIETVVLLDRFLFLSENNLYPTLKPIFDPKLSPRNFALLSTKSS